MFRSDFFEDRIKETLYPMPKRQNPTGSPNNHLSNTTVAEQLPGQRQPETVQGQTRSGRNIRKPQRLITVKQSIVEQDWHFMDRMNAKY
mmetsp:Transcript_46396/g.55839  ORF Transcript_46396/g.55839 Transcript_46396/m.55839 type:complete len:89 (+) Transcript_46396:436-702(+)